MSGEIEDAAAAAWAIPARSGRRSPGALARAWRGRARRGRGGAQRCWPRCSTGRGRTCERRGAGGEDTRATRPSRRRRSVGGGEEAAARRDGAPPARAIGAAARTQRRGGGGGAGAGDAGGRRCSAPSTHTCGAEAGAAGSRSAQALGGELRLTCAVSRGKRAARGQGESVSGVVRREARRAAGGHKLEDNLWRW